MLNRGKCPTREMLFEAIHGLLDSRGQRSIRDHSARCATCEAAFQTLAADLVASELHRQPEADQTINPRSFSRPRIVAASLSAIAALVLLALVLPRHAPASFSNEQIWPELETTTVLRSTPTFLDAAAMIDAYRAHDAQQLIDLSGELQPGPATSFYYLLRVSALIDLGRDEEALEQLQRLSFAYLPQPGLRRAQWLEYEAHRRLGDHEQADALLVQLVEEDGKVGEWARQERVPSR